MGWEEAGRHEGSTWKQQRRRRRGTGSNGEREPLAPAQRILRPLVMFLASLIESACAAVLEARDTHGERESFCTAATASDGRSSLRDKRQGRESCVPWLVFTNELLVSAETTSISRALS